MDLQYNITYRQKDKGRQYIISYKVDSKWRQKAKQGYRTKQEAKKASDKALSELKEYLLENRVINHDYNNITFKEFYEIYNYDNKLYITASTAENLKYSVNNFKLIHDKKLKDITTSDIQVVIDNMYRENRKQTTVRSRLAYINILFNAAVNKYNIITESPAADVKLKKNIDKPERRALDKKEVDDLLEALKNDKLSYYIVALTASTTGMRIGEILGLTKGDIGEDTINVNKQYKMIGDNVFGLGPLKSKNSNRIIPVPKTTIDAINSFMVLYSPAPDGRIFNFGVKRSFQTSLNRRLKELGFNVCMHELRHTYATNLIASGVDLKTAAYILGHDMKMTMNVYSHVNNSMLNDAKDKINNLFK